MLYSRLVDGRLLVKIRSGWGRGGGEGPIKGLMGRRDPATEPPPAPGTAARTNGRPDARRRRALPLDPRNKLIIVYCCNCIALYYYNACTITLVCA